MTRSVIVIEDAETSIRQTVKTEYFRKTPKIRIDKKIKEIITQAAVELPDSLKQAASKSLWQFYAEQYRELKRSFGGKIAVLTAVLLLGGQTLEGEEIKPTAAQKRRAIEVLEDAGIVEPNLPQQAMHKYSQDYINKNVRPILDRLAGQFATDPDTLDRRIHLRVKAEMEARWQDHVDEVDGFKKRGVRLVICSEHTDCSDRCRPWQGRVYSLDGTSGTTDDGRKFVPLEEATSSEKVKYTTKAGVTYYNGLFGFNCRHYLVEYKGGYKFPKNSEEKQKKEYAITQEQRALEREVRKWKVKAIESKGLDPQGYKEARANVIEANKRYIEFCRANGRAYYPSRTKII